MVFHSFSRLSCARERERWLRQTARGRANRSSRQMVIEQPVPRRPDSTRVVDCSHAKITFFFFFFLAFHVLLCCAHRFWPLLLLLLDDDRRCRTATITFKCIMLSSLFSPFFCFTHTHTHTHTVLNANAIISRAP